MVRRRWPCGAPRVGRLKSFLIHVIRQLLVYPFISILPRCLRDVFTDSVDLVTDMVVRANLKSSALIP